MSNDSIVWSIVIPIIVGAIIGFSIPLPTLAQAQQPFNVYETKGACIYVVGSVNPAIAVIPKSTVDARGGC